MGDSSQLLDRPDTRPAPECPAEVLAAARAERQAADAAEVRLLELAVAWALMHPVRPNTDDLPEVRRLRCEAPEEALAISGQGCPEVREYATAEFAAVVGMSPEAGKCYLGQALELRYRLPKLWARVTAGGLPVWKARRVAEETIRLCPEAAGFVDRQVAPVAHKVRPAQLDRVVNEAIGRY